MASSNQTIAFENSAAGDALIVQKVVGVEQLSGLFRFDLELLSKDKELDLAEVVAASSRVGLKHKFKAAGGGVGTREYWYEGVLTEFEQQEEGQGWVSYRAVLVPKVAELGEFWRSRIFMKQSCPEFTQEVLEGLELGRGVLPPEGQSSGGSWGDFVFARPLAKKLPDKPTKAKDDQKEYPLRDYVVQYEESDWDFVSRWLEHEGVYYFFENDSKNDKRERIVFSDSSPSSDPVGSRSEFSYRPQEDVGAIGSTQEEEIVQLVCRQTRAPKEVVLNDYNWRDALRLSNKTTVDDKGVGLQTEYNDHYKNNAQGEALAQVRKEELLCRTQLFEGTGTCRSFRPGKKFTLKDHYRGDWNQDYLLVSVSHFADQSGTALATESSYYNTFSAIPLGVPFRPERLAEWPSIKGVMHGKVDAEGDKTYADLDDGCYTVRIPYDPHYDDEDEESGRKPGFASRRMRMAQPFSGMDAGFNFPLRPGTEVILTHIDGDPDRPIIAGAVPNAETGNVGTLGDESRNRIVSNTGNAFEIHDTVGATGFVMVDTTGSVVSDQRHRLGTTTGVNGGAGGSTGGGGGGARARAPQAGPQARPRPKTPEEVKALRPGELSKSVAAPTSGQSQKTSELPQSGSGMARHAGAGEKGGQEEWNDNGINPASAYATFIGAPAAADLTQRTYLDPAVPAEIDNPDYDATLPTSATNSLLTPNPDYPGAIWPYSALGGADTATAGVVDWGGPLDAVFKKVLDKHHLFMTKADADARATYVSGGLGANLLSAAAAVPNMTKFGVMETAGAGGGKKDEFLAQVNNFDSIAFGSRLRIWLGDTVQINKGEKYTYGDCTHDVSYGTGGYGFHEEAGDTNDESYQYGNASSLSKTFGNTNDHSETTGDATSFSQTMGHLNETSFFFGTKISFDFKVSAETSTSVALSGENSNSMMLGVKADFDVFVGLKGKLEIEVAGAAELKISAGRVLTTAALEASINVPHKDEIDVSKLQIALNETQTILTATTATVSQNNATLSETQAALSETNAALSKSVAIGTDNRAALSKSAAALSESSAALNDNQAALSATNAAASATSLSGVHIIS